MVETRPEARWLSPLTARLAGEIVSPGLWAANSRAYWGAMDNGAPKLRLGPADVAVLPQRERRYPDP